MRDPNAAAPGQEKAGSREYTILNKALMENDDLEARPGPEKAGSRKCTLLNKNLNTFNFI